MGMRYNNVSYKWVDEYGLLAKIIGGTRFDSLTGLTYMNLGKPPAVDLGVAARALSEKRAARSKGLNDVKPVNYAILGGFQKGFGEKFRNAFDMKYWKQLKEDNFNYRRITPRQ